MATNTVGIDKEVEVDRKENLRDHRLYWIGRRTQDVILSSLALVVLSPVMLDWSKENQRFRRSL